MWRRMAHDEAADGRNHRRSRHTHQLILLSSSTSCCL